MLSKVPFFIFFSSGPKTFSLFTLTSTLRFCLCALSISKNVPAAENRSCLGFDGFVCCDGYLLDQTTGQCKRCPPGYHLKNCSKQCSAPNYGEECQSVCQCPDVYCHFAEGCSQHVNSYNSYQPQVTTTENTARQKTFSSTKSTSNLTVSYWTEGETVPTLFPYNNYKTCALRSTTNSTSVNSNVDIPSNQNNGEYTAFTNLYEDDNGPYLVGEVEAQYTEPSPTAQIQSDAE
uniref:Uncharacterized protein n=1 Tax=Magallana gigas TaxID=29159 RepID=A0A8W8NZT9_MAGGI